jgi:CRP-like cAMP-binding protein
MTQLEAATLRAPLIAKLERFVDLTGEERNCLLRLQGEFTGIREGSDIVTAGHSYRGLFVLCRGMAMRYKVLHDGRRHILNLILPGDLIGFPGCLFDSSLYSIASLSDAIVCPIAHEHLFTLFRQQPRLATALFWMVGQEAAMFAEHLVGVGRQTAYERIAHLLLELLVRLRAVGIADEHSYCLPMTQEQMADALGLSAPHVNRTLRRLREDGLVSLDGMRVTCVDVSALSRLADFNGATLSKRQIPGL